VVLLALVAQAGAVERDDTRFLERAPVHHPAIRREQPRPTEHVAFGQRLNLQRAARRVHLEHHQAVADQVEALGGFALAQQQLAGAVVLVHGAARNQFQLLT
jgi:hypothetical protein